MTVVGNGTAGAQVVCSALELIRNRANELDGTTDTTVFLAGLLGSEWTENASIDQINNIWFNVRCAVSYDQALLYALIRSDTKEGYNERNINPELLYSLGGNTYYNNTFWRRIYKGNERIQVDFKNFNAINTHIHLRNFNLFREVIPKDMKLEY